MAGGVVAGFLWALELATRARMNEPRWLFLLPLAGLLSGWIFLRFGKEANRGSNLIVDEIHDPQNTLPLRMVPLVLGGTVLTHLAGGSAGRESAAVQAGASLSDQLARIFKVEPEERKILLVCGAGAGFAAGIGTPLAGMIFGMEVIQIGRLRLFAWLECLVASFVAEEVARFLEAPHLVFPPVEIPALGLGLVGTVIGFGLLCGLAARLFVACVHLVERAQARVVSAAVLRPLVGGLILVPLFLLGGFARYEGLGLEEILAAFLRPASVFDPVLKAFFTALTVGSGFKGGEFIPLVFLGTTLGSSLAGLFGLSISFFAALGFAAVFAGAANTPVACAFLAMEIFGWKIAPYAVVACFLSYYASGHAGIYRTQRRQGSKTECLAAALRLLGELPGRFR
jgi:H+/Cl- antiporter ClcA